MLALSKLLTLEEMITEVDNRLTSNYTVIGQQTKEVICLNHVPITQWTLPPYSNPYTEYSHNYVDFNKIDTVKKLINTNVGSKSSDNLLKSIKISFRNRKADNNLGYLVINKFHLRYPKVLTAEANQSSIEEPYSIPVSKDIVEGKKDNLVINFQNNVLVRDLYQSLKSAYLTSYMQEIEPFDENKQMWLSMVTNNDTPQFAYRVLEINGINFETGTYRMMHSIMKNTHPEFIMKLCYSDVKPEDVNILIDSMRRSVECFSMLSDEEILEKIKVFLKHNVVANVELGNCYYEHIITRLKSNNYSNSSDSKSIINSTVSDTVEYVPILYKFHNIFNISYMIFIEYVNKLSNNSNSSYNVGERPIFYAENLKRFEQSPIYSFFINEKIYRTVVQNMDVNKMFDTQAIYVTRVDVQDLMSNSSGYLSNNPAVSSITNFLYWKYIFSPNDHNYMRDNLYKSENGKTHYPYNDNVDNYDYRCFNTRFLPYMFKYMGYNIKFEDIAYNVYIESHRATTPDFGSDVFYINHITSNSITSEHRQLYVRKYFIFVRGQHGSSSNKANGVYRFIEKGFVTESGYMRTVISRCLKLPNNFINGNDYDEEGFKSYLYATNNNHGSNVNNSLYKTNVSSGAPFGEIIEYFDCTPETLSTNSEFNEAEYYDCYFAKEIEQRDYDDDTADGFTINDDFITWIRDENGNKIPDSSIILNAFKSSVNTSTASNSDAPTLRNINYTGYADFVRSCRILCDSYDNARATKLDKSTNMYKIIAFSESNFSNVVVRDSDMDSVIRNYINMIEEYYD